MLLVLKCPTELLASILLGKLRKDMLSVSGYLVGA